jgi:hypothetical protein
VHGGVRKAPEWVGFVRQKVGGLQGIFAGSDGLTAKGAVSPTSFDSFHDCKLAAPHPEPAGLLLTTWRAIEEIRVDKAPSLLEVEHAELIYSG